MLNLREIFSTDMSWYEEHLWKFSMQKSITKSSSVIIFMTHIQDNRHPTHLIVWHTCKTIRTKVVGWLVMFSAANQNNW